MQQKKSKKQRKKGAEKIVVAAGQPACQPYSRRVVVSIDAPAWTVGVVVAAVAAVLIALAIMAASLPRSLALAGSEPYRCVRPAKPCDIERSLTAATAAYGRSWYGGTLRHAARVLALGERVTGISHSDVVAIMATESEMRTTAVNVNANGSVDHGLTQQNSRYIERRYSAASAILSAEGMWHDRSDKYDVALNIMACYLYMNDIIQELGPGAARADVIKAYNVGVGGLRTNGERAAAYYARFERCTESIEGVM